MTYNYDFFCLGGASVDLILKAPRLPLSGEKLVLDFHGQQPGGLVANAACAASRLGLHTAWAGTIADDERGNLILDDFANFNVDASHITVLPDENSNFTVILLEPSGERTILIVPVLPSPPPLDETVLAALSQAKMVYSIPFGAEWVETIANAVHLGGGILALDVEASSPAQGGELESVLRHADLVFCSLSGLQLASGIDDVQAGAKRLLEMGITCVVVTLGSQGAWAFRQNQALYTPALEVPVVDTTGAGDCFHAAFAFGYLENWSLEQSLQFATTAAALAVQEIGARAGYPTCADIDSL